MSTQRQARTMEELFDEMIELTDKVKEDLDKQQRLQEDPEVRKQMEDCAKSRQEQ
jgi:hypothetical protein